MDIIIVLIPVAIILIGIAIWGFLWAVNSGQYDDLETKGHSILFDDDNDKNHDKQNEPADREDHSSTKQAGSDPSEKEKP